MAGPLHSWDVFLEGYQHCIAIAKDMQSINRLSKKANWEWRHNIQAILQQGRVIIITDPLLHIVFASSNITVMNGYFPEEVVGQRPSLFQGASTEEEAKQTIRKALLQTISFDIIITNYRKDGSAYRCHIQGYPVFTTTNKLVHFIAFENIVYA